jgi:hypothetical protein
MARLGIRWNIFTANLTRVSHRVGRGAWKDVNEGKAVSVRSRFQLWRVAETILENFLEVSAGRAQKESPVDQANPSPHVYQTEQQKGDVG